MATLVLAVTQKALNERLDERPLAIDERSDDGAALKATIKGCSLVIVPGDPARLVARLHVEMGSFTDAGGARYHLAGRIAAFRVAVCPPEARFPYVAMHTLRTRDDLEPSQSTLPDFGSSLPAPRVSSTDSWRSRAGMRTPSSYR